MFPCVPVMSLPLILLVVLGLLVGSANSTCTPDNTAGCPTVPCGGGQGSAQHDVCYPGTCANMTGKCNLNQHGIQYYCCPVRQAPTFKCVGGRCVQKTGGIGKDLCEQACVPAQLGSFAMGAQADAETAACNDTDAAMIKTHWDDFNKLEQSCAKGCLFKSECTGNCIATKVGGMGKQCGNCFGSGATCVAKNCAMKCLLNPSSKSCCDCARSSCGSGLESCTGFVAGTSYPHCDG